MNPVEKRSTRRDGGTRHAKTLAKMVFATGVILRVQQPVHDSHINEISIHSFIYFLLGWFIGSSSLLQLVASERAVSVNYSYHYNIITWQQQF